MAGASVMSLLLLGAVARPVGVERAGSVDSTVGVGAEVVAQTLDERGRQAVAAQGVEEREAGGEGRGRDAGGRGRLARRPPTGEPGPFADRDR